MKSIALAGALTASALALSLSSPAAAKSGHKEMQEKALQIPVCNRTLGTLSIQEPERHWWAEMNLGSPETIIKLFAVKSRCFRLVDRGRGLYAAETERRLSDNGQLQRRSNVGRGQMRAADYVLVPDLVTQNKNAGGSAVTGIIGTLLGGTVGALVGGIKINKRTATVTLTLVDVRTTEIRDVYEGRYKKNDLAWAAGGGAGDWSGVGAVGAGGYTNTEQGQVIASAYLDAFIQFVASVGGPSPSTMLPDSASSDAPIAALTPASRLNLRTGPSTRTQVLRTTSPGELLYPTGQETDGWIEVTDEMGMRGWTSRSHLQPAR